MPRWRTRADPAWTAAHGVDELHVVMFESYDDRGGKRATVVVQIPEAGKDRIGFALGEAARLGARVLFVCDTRRQAEGIARTAARRLPRHRRVAYERAAAGGWGLQ